MNEDLIFIKTKVFPCYYYAIFASILEKQKHIYYLSYQQDKVSRAPLHQNALCVYRGMNRKVSVCFESCVAAEFFLKNDCYTVHSLLLAQQRGSGAVELTIHFSHTTRHKLSCFLHSQCVLELRSKYIFGIISSWRSQR